MINLLKVPQNIVFGIINTDTLSMKYDRLASTFSYQRTR